MSLAEQRRLWAWHLSALVYEWSYIQVAHQIDEDFLDYLGERVVGAVVADCGCGPGVVTEKLLQAGAARVVAIDANASMLERAKARLAKRVATGKVVVCQTSHEASTLAGICQQALGGYGFDEEYTLYTCRELLALLCEAVPKAHVERLPSQQRPYNLVALHVP